MSACASRSNLPERLREIAALDREHCVLRWTETFGKAPPKYLSVRFMQRVLVQEAQCQALGDHTAQIRRVLRAASRTAQRDDSRPTHPAPPGSYLVREWNGRTYRIEVTASGFMLDGQTYESLSAVARRITGAHWSGPRFFGLLPKRAA